MQFPFRKSINPEDAPDDQQEWTVPSYALPMAEEKKGEAWKPPSYAKVDDIKPVETEREKAKKKVTFGGSLKEFLKSAKKDVGDLWEKVETPITHSIPKIKDLHPFDKLSKMIDPDQGGTEGFGFNRPTASAFAEGVGSGLETLASPFNLGLMALSGGASLFRGAATRALPDIAELAKATTTARAANNPRLLAKLTDELATAREAYGANAAKAGIAHGVERGAMGGIAANAANEGIKNKDPNQIAPFVLGVLGAKGGAKTPKLPDSHITAGEISLRPSEPPVSQRSREIPYRMGSSVQEPPSLPKYESPTNPTGIESTQQKLENYIKNNPNAEMADVEEFIKSVEQTTNVEPRKSTLGIEDIKPNKQEKKPFVNPFEKPREIVDEQAERIKNEFLDLNKSKPEVLDETPTSSHGPTNEYFNSKKYDLSFSSDAQNAASKSKTRGFRKWADKKAAEKEEAKIIVDEKGTSVAPVQEELPIELPYKAPGTEFVADAPKEVSDQPPIKRDILRDYTGEKFNPDTYDKARDMFKMGKDLPADAVKSSEAWKAPDYFKPDYAQASEDASKMVEPQATPELVDKLPSGLEGDIKAPKLITEKPITSSVDDSMEAANRLEKENPNYQSLSETEYDDLHAKHLNDIKSERSNNPDEITELQGGLGGFSPSKRPLEPSSGPYGNALDKLFNSMGTISEKRLEQDVINKTERARRFADFSSVDEVGASGAAQSLSKLKGAFDKVDLDKLQMTKPQVDSLFTAVKRANITTGEKARGYTTLFKLFNGELPQRNELALLDDVFGNNFASKITELHGGIGAVGLNISKIANTMKSMMSSVDLSAPLRQGIGLATRKEFYPAFRDMFKFFGNREFYTKSMQAIEERPNYLLGRESDLFIAKPGTLQSGEEAFLNSYIGQIPGVSHIVDASDRAYTGFLNKLRADTFDSMIERAKELGHDVGNETAATKEAKAIARFINTATGRGDLGKLNKITNELNVLLWSPRLIASRIQMLTNPKIYTDLPKGMRLEGLKSLFGIAALGVVTDTLARYAGGAKISTNILSSDFGKSRFGDQVVDPWGGYQQYIVAAARLLAGKTDSKMPTSRLDIAGRFAANKESPIASLAHTLLTAKKFTGDSNNPKTAGNFTNEYGQKTSVQGEVAKRFIPMFTQDMIELIQSNPDWSEHVGLTAAMAGAGVFGMGVQSYPEKKKSVFGRMRVR